MLFSSKNRETNRESVLFSDSKQKQIALLGNLVKQDIYKILATIQ